MNDAIDDRDRAKRISEVRKKIDVTCIEKNAEKVDIIGYLAGFFDGEGCITIEARRGKSFNVRCSITNSSLEVLKIFKKIFGGSIHKRKLYVNKPLWDWRCNAHLALFFLTKIMPYLIVKNKEAKLALEFGFKFYKLRIEN